MKPSSRFASAISFGPTLYLLSGKKYGSNSSNVFELSR